MTTKKIIGYTILILILIACMGVIVYMNGVKTMLIVAVVTLLSSSIMIYAVTLISDENN